MMNFNAYIPASEFGLDSDKRVLGFCPAPLPKGTRFAQPDREYTFQPELFERFRLWWEAEDTREPMWISGPAGAGKTSFVMQFLRRVNAPAVTLTCRRRMDKYELIGQWGSDPTTGQLVWIDGPATIAWRTGAVLVINEPSSAPADMWVACNDLLEGDDIVIDRTGEVVHRHPNARIVFTDNRPLGDASETPEYLGRHAQDRSVFDRTWSLVVGYPEKDVEVELLWKKVAAQAEGLDPKRARNIIETVVDFSLSLREQNEQKPSEVPQMSQRGLTRFIGLLFTFAKAPVANGVKPVSIALSLALTDGLSPSSAIALQNLIQYDFGRLDKLVAGK